MLKSYDIKKTLEHIEDYDSYYNRDEKLENVEASFEDGQEGDLSGIFSSETEAKFYEYGKDLDFVRYHKRVTKNFSMVLQEILDSPKQTVIRGITKTHSIAINSIRLNKSCTVANVFWQLIALPANLIPDDMKKV